MNFKRNFVQRKDRFLQKLKSDPLSGLLLLLIFLIAIYFRTYSYPERIYVYADNSLFVQAAYYAKEGFKIPQVGPFAQGPFFTGPWWLWILESMFMFPFGLLTPWYFMSGISIIFIILIYIAGKDIGGKWFGTIAAFLTSISTAQIDNSFMTWNAAADPFLGLLSIICFLKYRKERQLKYIFFLGFFVSLATTIHFQSAFLFPLVLVTLLSTKPRLKSIIAVMAGIFIPFLPFLYFDIRFHWFETRRILDYVLIGQYRIYIPNRWLTYASEYWPKMWAWMIGGQVWIAWLLMILTAIVSFINLRQFKKHQNYYLILLSFILSIIMLRYFRGERQFYYTNYAHAYVLLITSWMIFELFKLRKILGLMILTVLTIFSLDASVKNFAPRVITYLQVQRFVSQIYEKYPEKNFDIYECPFTASLISTPVSYIMYYDGRNTLDGVKIGVCNENFKPTWRELGDNEVNKEYGYSNKSTPHIYTTMTEWWIQNPPTESLY